MAQIQYQSITGPLNTDTAVAAEEGWNDVPLPNAPLRIRSVASIPVTALDPLPIAGAITTFDWSKTPLPTAPRRLRSPQQPYKAAHEQFGYIQTVPVMAWTGNYPDYTLRYVSRHAAMAAGMAVVPWSTTGPRDAGAPIIATGSIKQLLQYQALVAPFFEVIIPPPDEVSTFSYYAERVWPKRGLHASRNPHWFSDRFDAPAGVAAPDLSWQGRYADRVNARRGLNHSLQLAFAAEGLFLTPQVAPAPELSWKTSYPDSILKKRSIVLYGSFIPEFPAIVSVPVMSWTGLYLDPPVRRKSGRALFASGSPHLLVHSLVAPAAPVLSWHPDYPDRNEPRLFSLAALEARASAPIFIADVTVAPPPSSWEPEYQNFIWAASRVLAGAQPNFFFDRFDVPDEVIAPDLAVAIYPDFVRGRRPVTDLRSYGFPVFTPDATEPNTPLQWLARYPDRIIRLKVPAAQQETWKAPLFISGVTLIAPNSAWQGRYPDRIWRRRALPVALHPSFITDAKWDAPPLFIVTSIDGDVYIVRTMEEVVYIMRTLSQDVRIG